MASYGYNRHPYATTAARKGKVRMTVAPKRRPNGQVVVRKATRAELAAAGITSGSVWDKAR